MNLRHLEVFRAIMRHGSLTAAAEALHVSQPAISKVLRHFEARIGYRLFDRIGGRLVATAEAELLFRDADRIFREVEVLKGFSDRIRDKQVGLLRIASSAPPAFALLPHAIEQFHRRNPGARIVVHTLPAEEIAERILIGDVDMGLTLAAIAEPQVRCTVIDRTEIVAVMHREHALAGRAFLGPQDFEGVSMISYGSQPLMGRLLDRVFREAGLRHEPQFEITMSIAAALFVARGLGVALVDGLMPWRNFGDFVVLPFRPRVEMEVVLTTSLALPSSRFANEFKDDLEAAARALRHAKG
ncbi:MAG: LysR family transcriptional regulator [Rhizobiales bacterium]|nr:LysR family transcriptional regulator [Hyphomicrobiales bacterium]